MDFKNFVRGAVVVAALTGSISMASDQPTGLAPVHKTILDNGLTVLVREDHSAPVVSAQAWCRAGSVTEGAWMGAGLSHVLEHMLFKGTASRGVGVIANEVKSKGGVMNAYTSFEQTVYHIDLPAENWKSAVDILADCMMNATISTEELAKEKQVILREMAMRQDDPGTRARQILWSTAYTTHPYRHPVIGYREIYERTTRDDVYAYYKKHYVPNNLLFVVVGDINAVEVTTHIRELTKDFKMNAVGPATVLVEPPQVSTRERHEDAAVQLSNVMLAWHVTAGSHADVPAIDVLGIIAGNGRSSRLYRELQQNQGLGHSVEAGAYTPTYPGIFVVNAKADANQRDAAIAGIRAELRKLREHPVSDEECRKAVKASLSDYYSRLKTMDGQAADLGHNELVFGDPNFSPTYIEALRHVTPADVQRVARQYLADNNLTITSLDPVGTNAGTTTAAAVKSEITIQKFELPNGVRLLVREDAKLPFVDFRVLLKGGVIAETSANNGITKLTARMLLKGTKTRTADRIAESIESVGGDINFIAGNNSFGVATRVMKDDFDLGLDVLADVLLNPTFPDNNLARERDTQLAEIKADQDQILRSCQQLLRESLYRTHPYRLNALGTSATVSKLTRDQLAGFHRHFVVPGNMVVTVFGDVKADDVRKKLEAKFGKLKPTPAVFPKSDPEKLTASVRKEATQQREQAVLLIGFSGPDMFSKDRYAVELLDELYSGLGSRLFVRLRDKLNLCYYSGAYEHLGLDAGYVAFYVGTTAEKVERCEKEIFAELEEVKAAGITAEELERARNATLGQRQIEMQDNSTLSLMVGLDELYGLGYNFFKQADERYRAVTLDDVKRAANTYFVSDRNAVAVVHPATKAN